MYQIMQIASHKTNIGDGANITGFQKTFIEDAIEKGHNVSFVNEEIMEYKPHLGDKDFNGQDFIDKANSVDLIIIGGGGFFSAFERFKNTGCHVDFTLETLNKITTPIVYYAQGFSVYYGQKYHNTDKLERLLVYAIENNTKVKISFRNDGSKERAMNFIKSDVIQNTPIIPDGGFFVPTEDSEHTELDKNQINIGLQLAGDKTQFRFQENNNVFFRAIRKLLSPVFDIQISKNQTQKLKEISKVLSKEISERKANLILLPHIHSDLSITDKFTHILPKELVRFSTNICGVYKGHKGSRKQFDLYRQLDLVVGMRFHSNVCAFAVETPSIGLVSHDQLDSLYENLGHDDYVHLSSPDFENKLQSKVQYMLDNKEKVIDGRKATLAKLRKTTKNFHNEIIDWAF